MGQVCVNALCPGWRGCCYYKPEKPKKDRRIPVDFYQGTGQGEAFGIKTFGTSNVMAGFHRAEGGAEKASIN